MMKIKIKNKKVKRSSGFTNNWQQALIALALSTASGGFLFGAMSFLLPRYFEIHLASLSTNVAITGIFAGDCLCMCVLCSSSNWVAYR